MDSNGKLDAVLRCFKDINMSYPENGILPLELQSIYNNGELRPILDKLIKDGFVEPKIISLDNPNISVEDSRITQKKYQITFEGIVFKDNGGYTQQQNNLTTSRILQSVQTWAIAIGTIGLLIWEMRKLLFRLFCG